MLNRDLKGEININWNLARMLPKYCKYRGSWLLLYIMVIKLKSVEYFWTVGDSFDDELQIFPQCKISYQERERLKKRKTKNISFTSSQLV